MNGYLGLRHMGNDQPGQEQHGSTGQGSPGHCTHLSALQRVREKLQSLEDIGSKSRFHSVNI